MAKCKKCDKEALPGKEFCASCRESQDYKKKKIWELFCGACVIAAGAVAVFLGKKSGDVGDASA